MKKLSEQCGRVQEELAWARAGELDAESRLHLPGCESCGKQAVDLAALESVFQDASDQSLPGGKGGPIAVPEDFADRVMSRIAQGYQSNPWESFWRRMQSPPARLRLAYASVVLLVLLGLAPSAI